MKHPTTPIGSAIGWGVTLALAVLMLGSFGLAVVSSAVHSGARFADVVHESMRSAAMIAGTGIVSLVGLGTLITIARVVGFGAALAVDHVSVLFSGPQR
jgi:hypothetical protein